MQFISFLIIAILLLPSILSAACGESPVACTVNGASYTANSACYLDVKDCTDKIDTNLAYGATLNIPACVAGDCIWTAGITITKNIQIVGVGSTGDTQTYITNGMTATSNSYKFIFLFDPDSTAANNIHSLANNTAKFDVSKIHFYDTSQHDYVYPIGIYQESAIPIQRVRIHDNAFSTFARAVKIVGYVSGVFDNNVMTDCSAIAPEGAIGHWSNEIRHLGTEEAFFVEDNVFNNIKTSNIYFVDNDRGFSTVARYNTIQGNATASQRTWETHPTGSQFSEVYGNKSTVASLSPQLRGGIGIIYFNQGAHDSAVELREEYSEQFVVDAGMRNEIHPASTACPFPTAYNPVTGASPQRCIDSLDAGTPCNCDKVNHTYIWNNRNAVGTLLAVTEGEDDWDTDSTPATPNSGIGDIAKPELVENREYFSYTGTFTGTDAIDGTNGIGCGTLDQMNAITPTLVNAGYWVTTQDNCNAVTGYVGAASDRATPTTKIEGTLYRWNGSEWVSYYTPYTYPHPLRVQKFTGNLCIGCGGQYN